MRGLRAFSFFLGALWLGAPAGGKPDRVAAGTWGGQGVGMEVTEKGADIQYDCAHGTIDEAILTDAEGRFEVKGLHFRERGGPVRQGAEPKGEPVRYSGQVDGTTMKLKVQFVERDGDDAIGTFTLVHGKSPRIHKCL